MSEKQITWPNNARVAFVLGIAFEAWDRTKPSRMRVAVLAGLAGLWRVSR